MRLQKIISITLGLITISVSAQNELNFGEVYELVSEIESPILLKSEDSRILVSGNQSQIITSSVNGDEGYSYGWLEAGTIKKNRELGTTYFYGGEDRFWLNPLGSTFSLYYGQNPIVPENWQIPDLFSKETFTKIEETDESVIFKKENATITNNIGTQFVIDVKRKVHILSDEDIVNLLKVRLPIKVKKVGFSSETTIVNKGKDWSKEKGLVTPWTLGMFKGTPTSVGIFPYSVKRDLLELSNYFFKKEKERLQVKREVVYFKTDGAQRSKVGLKAKNAKNVIGNYDYKNNRLTIIQYSFAPEGDFLSSDETHLENAFNGDVVNSYNNSSNKSKATFFELETTAPAKVLKKNKSITHRHSTFHFEGNQEDLNTISKVVLGCDLSILNTIFE